MIDLRQYKKDGFFLSKGFFEPRELDQIRTEAQAIFVSQMRRRGIIAGDSFCEEEFEQGMYHLFEIDLQSFINCGKHAQHLISLHRLALDQRVLAALRELGLSFPAVSTRPLLYFNSPRLATKEVYWRLSLHQDWRSIQGSLDSVVIWVPLVRITRELGALEVLPGSHRRGLLAAELVDGYGHISEAIETSGLVTVEVETGDALFFSTLLLHRSGTNVTNSIRWSCHFRYNNLAEGTFIERGLPHPYIYKPSPELVTENFPTPEQVEDIFR